MRKWCTFKILTSDGGRLRWETIDLYNLQGHRIA